MNEDITILFAKSGWTPPDDYPILGAVRQSSSVMFVVGVFSIYKITLSGDELLIKVQQLME